MSEPLDSHDDDEFRTILEHAPVMIDSFAPDGTCLLWNRECERRLGFSHAELLELDDVFSAFYPDPEELARVRADVARCDGQFREYRVRAKDGSARIQLWANFRMPASGKIISVGHDVTERRAIEAQLLQAQKMEAIGQLTGGLAHDFNNLLTVILGSADLLVTHVQGDELATELLSHIHAATEDGTALVRQLSVFSRHRQPARETLDLNALLAELDPTLRLLVPASTELRVECAKGPLYIHADAIAVRQILLNLVANARDAMEDPGTIRIATDVVRSESGERVVLSVTDTGAGIAPELISQVFDPLFTTKAPGEGTGLGLPSVQRLVRQHDGEVKLSSELGRGTRIEILLPIAPAPAAQRTRPSDGKQLVARGGETVLIVDDDVGARTTCRASLQRLGYAVLEAANGVEALALLKTRSDIALVISDVVMPKMTGPELLSRMRESGLGSVRFALWTGYAPGSVISRMNDSVPMLSKPFTLSALGEFVRRCLEQPEQQSASPPA